MNDITALAQQLRATAEKANEHGEFNMAMHTVEVLALVEALEKAQKSNQFMKDQLSELANFNQDWDKLEASYESWREIAAELLVAKNRIAELESRTVTVKLPPRVDSSNVPFTAHTWNCCLDAVEKCLAAAGIQVIEGEQKNG